LRREVQTDRERDLTEGRVGKREKRFKLGRSQKDIDLKEKKVKERMRKRERERETETETEIYLTRENEKQR
jgi:hypothetical protein